MQLNDTVIQVVTFYPQCIYYTGYVQRYKSNWLYRVKIDEPQYVITYAGNEHMEVVGNISKQQ